LVHQDTGEGFRFSAQSKASARGDDVLDSRYDDVKSGRVKPIDGEAFFDTLRRRKDELLK
jgi:hypothetical protein